MIYFLASANPLDHIIGVLIFLVCNIYHIAAWAFEVFLVLSTGKILDSEKYSLIIQNFYIVLGVVLLFFLSFSLLKGIVDPDDNKQGGSVIKTSIINLVTSVIILALLPTIFGFLYDFQTSFITKYNVIGRFFGYGNLGTPTSTKDTDYICQMDNESIKEGAFQITNGVFTAFFNVNSEKCSTKVNSLESLKNCQNDVTPKDGIFFITWSSGRPSFYETIGRVNRNGFFSSYIDFSTNVREGDITFNFILSLIAGLLLIYVGISYSLDMALRMVKLVFYQIIAPIPIFARVVPDGPLKGSFEKWLKIVLACYLEVYIRILSFYFVVYLCVAMLDSSYIGNIFLCFNPVVGLLTRAFLLMGMVMFMKQAPKLIGDATGLDTGNMKLGIREKLKDGGFFAAGSAIGSYIANRVSGGSVGSALGSAWRGGKDGWKNPSLKSIGAGAATGRTYRDAVNHGATPRGIRNNKMRSIIGLDTTYDEAMRNIDHQIEIEDDAINTFNNQIEAIRNVLVTERVTERTSGNNNFHQTADSIKARAKDRLNREDSVDNATISAVDKDGNVITQTGNLNALKKFIDQNGDRFNADQISELNRRWYAEQERLIDDYVSGVSAGTRNDAVMTNYLATIRSNGTLAQTLMDANGNSQLTGADLTNLNGSTNLWTIIDGIDGRVQGANGDLGRQTNDVAEQVRNLEHDKSLHQRAKQDLQDTKSNPENVRLRYEANASKNNNN